MSANSGRSVGSIADLDPVNHFYGSLNHAPNSQSAVYHDSRMMPPPKQEMTKSGVSLFSFPLLRTFERKKILQLQKYL